jgi:hypothetical protein
MNWLSYQKKSLWLLWIIIGLVACNAKTHTDETSASHGMKHADGDSHVHTYACPMHPEVHGAEGDRCSICGMPLEHMDHAPVSGRFNMELKAPVEKMEAGKPTRLILVPKNLDQPQAAVPLDVEHEKKIHLILVSEDLSWFDHIHPEYQPDGSYEVSETFPSGGRYFVYADYKPSGATHQLEKIEVQVDGKRIPAKTYSAPKTSATSGDYTVTLIPDGASFLSHETIHFDGAFSRYGNPFDVNQLSSYLGAKGHMVGIHLQNHTYVHLHPEVENGRLHFHTTFPEDGMYRVWLQFMAESKLHTVDFTLKVDKGKAMGSKDAKADDTHEGHKH